MSPACGRVVAVPDLGSTDASDGARRQLGGPGEPTAQPASWLHLATAGLPRQLALPGRRGLGRLRCGPRSLDADSPLPVEGISAGDLNGLAQSVVL